MKLTAKMQSVVNELKGAAPYYQAEGGNLDLLKVHSLTGMSTPQDGAHYLGDNLYGIYESSATIKALEKRGVLRIHRLGGGAMDIVELLDHTPVTPASELVAIEVVCEYEEPEMSTSFTEWAEPGAFAAAEQRIRERLEKIDNRMNVYIQEGATVPVTVWSPLA